MIVVDSSALVAILEEESEAAVFLHLVGESGRRLASAVTVYETGIVMTFRRGHEGVDDVFALIDELGLEIVPFAEPQVLAALSAYRRYGKGINSKSQLNLGDCVAYALAKSTNAPLLFKGDDFPQTDVARCA